MRPQVHAGQKASLDLLDMELSLGIQPGHHCTRQSLFDHDGGEEVAWPAYEGTESNPMHFLQGIAGTLELFHRSTLAFQGVVGEVTGHSVAVFQRIDQAGLRARSTNESLRTRIRSWCSDLITWYSEQEAAPGEIEAVRSR